MMRIKEILKAKGLTQIELADKLGVTRSAVVSILTGNPTIATLERIADVLDVHLLDLFKDDREGNPPTDCNSVNVCPHCNNKIEITIK